MNKVIGDFIDENKPIEIPPENDDASVIKSENDPDNVITIDSDDEIDIKEEDLQFIEPEVTRFDQHNETVVDPETLNRSQSNVLAEQLNIFGKNPRIDETPANKTKSKKRPSENLKLINPNTKRHRRSIRETNDSLVCEICNKRFCSSTRLIYHRRIHLEECSINCRICLQFFSSDRKRIVHEKDCNKQRYDCYACGKILQGLAQLEAHFRTHSGKKPWKCSKCPKKFAWHCRLRVHVEKVHKITSKKLINKRK